MGRDPREVFGRLMALRAVLWRTQFELHLTMNGAPREEIEPRHAELGRWLAAAKIPFSPRERELIDRALGTWTRDEIGELVWRNEAAAVLLWSLDLVPSLPPYTIAIPAAAVMQQIEQLPQLGESPPLRPAGEIEREHDLAELWNWRGRTARLQKQGMQPPAGDTFEATIARATQAALHAGLVDAADVVEGDLAIAAHIAYAAGDERIQSQLACVAHERHWALSWIADASTAWDTVNPST